MGRIAGLLVLALIAFGIYYFYLRQMPVTDKGTAATQAISLTGVRTDLLQIGQGERSYLAQNGKCGSLDELLSSNSLTMSKTERDGYTYSIDCSGTDFTVTARHPPAAEGSPIRYPVLAVDQTLEVHEVQ